MVIKEVSKAIADMFGIEITDYNSGIASQEGIYDGIEESAGNANKAVKELKRQVLGFDEIHNINENKDNGSGSSGGVSGGIDQRLLDAIKGYDNGMDKVRMKATEIRDKIMEWLGFTKEIDPLTGEVSFKYGGIKKTLKNMWESFKGLSTQGKILVGLGLVTGALKLWNAGKKLVNIFGNSGLFKIIKSLYNPTTTLFSSMITGLKSSHSSLKSGIQSWREQMGIIDSTTGKVNGFKGVLNGAKVAIEGMVTGAIGLYTVHESMKNLSTEGANLANVLGLVTGSLGTIASGVQIGAIFGPWGALIGGATGALATLVTGLLTYNSTIKNSEIYTDKYKESLSRLDEATRKAMETSIIELDRNKKLVDSLSDLFESNGKVKKGYEEKANYILTTMSEAYGIEYKLIDGVITKNGKEVKSLKEVQEEIKEKIKWMKMESVAEAYKEDYINSLKEEKKYQQEINKENENYQEKLDLIKEKTDTLNEAYMKNKIKADEYHKSRMELSKLLTKTNEQHTKSLEDLNLKYEDSKSKIKTYEDFQTAILSKNYDTALKLAGNYIDTSEERAEQFKNNFINTTNNISKSISEMFNKTPDNKKITINVDKTDYDSKIKEIIDKTLNKKVKLTTDETSLNNSIVVSFNKILKNFGLKEKGGIYSNGSWKDIPQYANGGAPSHGSLVFAGENGPEILGNANGRTEILNQSQIASAIYSAVYSAMSQFGGQSNEIEVHVHTDEGTVVDRINQKTKQTGVCPINIPI